jgi:hypothetical protein
MSKCGRLQTRLGRNIRSALTTMLIVGTDSAVDGGCGALWRTTPAENAARGLEQQRRLAGPAVA